MTPTTKSFSTSRIEQVAALLYRNVPVVDITVVDRRVEFAFSDADGHASEVVEEHDRGIMTVSSRRYAASIEQARDLVHGARRREGLSR